MGCSGGGYSGLNISYGGCSGCFSGNGKVQLKDKTFKKVKDLIKGDTLEDGSIVNCLIKIKVNKMQQVIELNDVYYSLKHPVMYSGKWTNPVNIKPPKTAYVDYWYNLVLKNGYSVKINGIEAITLGHKQKDKVAYHPYFGTDKAVNALKKYKEFSEGKIVIKKELNIERDENGRICKYY